MLCFGYVFAITLLYSLTGGIGRNIIRLTDIIIENVLENKKEIHLEGNLVSGQFLSHPPLDHAHSWICGAPRCFLHSDDGDRKLILRKGFVHVEQ